MCVCVWGGGGGGGRTPYIKINISQYQKRTREGGGAKSTNFESTYFMYGHNFRTNDQMELILIPNEVMEYFD